MNKYQLRIKSKEVNLDPELLESVEALDCEVAIIREIVCKAESVQKLLEIITTIPEFDNYEILSIVKFDFFNETQLGDAYNEDDYLDGI